MSLFSPCWDLEVYRARCYHVSDKHTMTDCPSVTLP